MAQVQDVSFMQPTPSIFNPQQELDIKRKRALADTMMKGGQQPDKTEVIGGVAVKQSPLAALARAIQQGVGGYESGQADKQDASYQVGKQKAYADAISKISTDPNAAAALLGQSPETMQMGAKIGEGTLENTRTRQNLAYKQTLENNAPTSDEKDFNMYKGLSADQQTQYQQFRSAAHPSLFGNLPSPSATAPSAPPQQGPLPGGSTLDQPMGDDFLKTLNPQVASIVKMIGDGNEKSGTILSRMSAPDKLSIMSSVQKYKPDYSANNFGAVKDFNTGKLGSQVRSFSVANSHLDTLSGLADALGNGDTRLFNAIGNRFSKETGSPAPQNFESAKQIVGDEIVKAIIGSGGTGGDRDKAQEAINSANSPAQLKGVIATYKTLMGGQLSGLRRQYEVSTGRKDFDKFLSDSAKTEVEMPNQAPQGPGQAKTTNWVIKDGKLVPAQ